LFEVASTDSLLHTDSVSISFHEANGASQVVEITMVLKKKLAVA